MGLIRRRTFFRNSKFFPIAPITTFFAIKIHFFCKIPSTTASDDFFAHFKCKMMNSRIFHSANFVPFSFFQFKDVSIIITKNWNKIYQKYLWIVWPALPPVIKTSFLKTIAAPRSNSLFKEILYLVQKIHVDYVSFSRAFEIVLLNLR